MVLVGNALQGKFTTKNQKHARNVHLEATITSIKLIAFVIQRNKLFLIFLISANVLIQDLYYHKVNVYPVMDILMLLQGLAYPVPNHQIW